MNIDGKAYRTIWLDEADRLHVIDQHVLPHRFETATLTSFSAVCDAIRNMLVRGAGLIGATAGYGMWLAACEAPAKDTEAFDAFMSDAATALKRTRPTASNLAWAVDRQLAAMTRGNSPEEKRHIAKITAQAIADEDAEACKRIVEAEMSTGKHLVQVGFMRRFDPGYQQLKKLIDSGKFGSPLMLHCAHRNYDDGGVGFTTNMPVENSMIHEIDVLRWLLGENYVKAEVVFPRTTRNACEGLKDPQIMYLTTESGIRIDVESFHENTGEDLEWFLNHVRSRIEAYAERNGLVLACGPAPFLKAVQGFALEAKARCQLSLESRMACGVGACLGCVTKTTEKWPVEEKAGTPVQTCTHGPVFWADQITLEA